MATKFERVLDIFASAGLEVSDQLVMSRFEARNDGETVSAETVRKARKLFEQMENEAATAANEEDTEVEEIAAPETEPFVFATEDGVYVPPKPAEDESIEDAKQDVYEESLEDENAGVEEIYKSAAKSNDIDDPEVFEEYDEPDPKPAADEPAAEEPAATEPEPEVAGNEPATEAPEAAPSATESSESNTETVITREPVEGRCNHRMERAGDLCGRPAGHPGVHTTVAQMEKKKAYSKNHAKDRYHSDPAYAEKVKEASRRSHKKARVAAKAAKEAAATAGGGQ